jgi:hypothetical protein
MAALMGKLPGISSTGWCTRVASGRRAGRSAARLRKSVCSTEAVLNAGESRQGVWIAGVVSQVALDSVALEDMPLNAMRTGASLGLRSV